MKVATLALFLAFTAHAQSIPATYPDRMDVKPIVMPACKRLGFHRDTPDGACYMQTNDGCNTTTWTETEFGVGGFSTAVACSSSYDLMFPLVTPATIPPAKHHSAAPQPHKSHGRRKVKRRANIIRSKPCMSETRGRFASNPK